MRIYIVQKGDTLYEIAKKNGTTLEEVIKLNPQLSSPDLIMPGMKIKIPGEMKRLKEEKKQDIKSLEKSARTNERPMGSTMEAEKRLENRAREQQRFQVPKAKESFDNKEKDSKHSMMYKRDSPATQMNESPQTEQSHYFTQNQFGSFPRQWNQQPTYGYMPVLPAMRQPAQEMGYPPMMCPCCMQHMMMLSPYQMQMNQREYSPHRRRRNYCPFS